VPAGTPAIGPVTWCGVVSRTGSSPKSSPGPHRAGRWTGAGEGRNAIWLAGLGWQVTAVDFSAVAVDRARRLAERQGVTVDWVVADLRDYQPAPGAFDAVVVAYLHLPPADPNVVLGRAAKALAPGGRILVAGHDVTNIDHGIGGPQDPRVLHTPRGIVAALPELRVRRADRVRRPVQTEQGAIDTLVCAVRE
jgi:SAM-dependent methyltransferase